MWQSIFFSLVVASALAVRMVYSRHWISWLTWLVVFGLAGIVFWQTGNQPQVAVLIALVASAFGFLLPELWQSFRGWLARPRNFGWLIVLGLVVYMFYHPELVGAVGTLIIILFGIWVMIGRPGRHRA